MNFSKTQKASCKHIFDEMKAAGCSNTAAAAICGNVFKESSFNPSKYQNDYNDKREVVGQGGGLCGWLDAYKEGSKTEFRFANYQKMVQWCHQNGYSGHKSVPAQTAYIRHSFLNEHLKGKINNTYGQTVSPSTFKSLNDIQVATLCWMAHWERPAINSADLNTRIAAAKVALNGCLNNDWKNDEALNSSEASSISASTTGAAPPPSPPPPPIPYSIEGDVDDPFEDLSAYAKYADFENSTQEELEPLGQKKNENDAIKNTTNENNQNASPQSNTQSEDTTTKMKPRTPILTQESSSTISQSEKSTNINENTDRSENKPDDKDSHDFDTFDNSSFKDDGTMIDTFAI